ncbi:hypothetical protein C6495_01610 [Candidatus Poribacteria bacterium]|nr:MAG: hypothetical protein C6495_01610 [Candidatus Poribacteria bacterium]
MIVLILAVCLAAHFYAEWEKMRFDASPPEPPAPTQVQAGTEAGHWQGDEWYAEPHNAVDAIASPQESAQDEGNLIPIDFTETAASTTYQLPAGLSREQQRQIWEAEKKWDREVLMPAIDEYLRLTEKPATFFSSIDEDFIRKLNNMSDEERAELAEKVMAPHKKSIAAYKRLRAIERNKPDFVTEVLGGE